MGVDSAQVHEVPPPGVAEVLFSMPDPASECTVRCPACAVETRVTMPADACVFFWDCPACAAVVRPSAGHCCVFCSYGSAPCPRSMAVYPLPPPGAAAGTMVALPRPVHVRRGLKLNYLTIAYNTMEAIVSLAAGLVAGSVALVGFGVDSGIEVTASVAAQWRLRADLDPGRRERVERVTRRVIGVSFLLLAAYVAAEGLLTLRARAAPEASRVGLVILVLSVLVMPVLARAKRRVARALQSRALEADAAQTSLCASLSVIALAGVGLNAALGWWWADPLAALAMVPIIGKEGVNGLRGEDGCECRAP